MILFRPVGIEELVHIYRSGLRRFPPRLQGQPIFYPVLSHEYAAQIARDWNTKSGYLAGYVTEFDIDDAYARSMPIRQAGAKQHRELWVPSETLADFNDHIHDDIRVVAAYFAPTFSGLIPTAFSLRGKDVRGQFAALWGICKYSLMDFHGEITANHEVVFAHFSYWEQVLGVEGAVTGVDAKALLAAIRQVWCAAFPNIALGVQAPREKAPEDTAAS